SYESARFNALRHGVLSRYTVLPWEDEGEYRPLLDALVAEHAPQGPTEEHLVEELAGIFWRKRRLRLAEAAAYHRGLARTIAPYRETVNAALVHLDVTRPFEKVIDAIRATPAETAEDMADLEKDEAMTRRALELLGASKADAYDAALTALREDTRHWWEEILVRGPGELEEVQEPYTADAAGLLRFLEGETLPWYAMRRTELANRPLICAQAFGEALEPDRLEPLGRYEVHLDRKLERMLTILIRLQNLRRAADPG
ncbi:MAG: hypothetical protein ACREX8_12940, partial [Gammaproteobacteria bacterium]